MMFSLTKVRELAKAGNVIPLFVRVPADLDTPVSTFLRLAKGKRHSFLLESIEGVEKLARYSFIAFDPFMRIEVSSPSVETVESKRRIVEIIRGRKRERMNAEPLVVVNQVLKRFRPVSIEGIPRFSGGAVGYFAYDTAGWVDKFSDVNPDEIDMPDCILGFYQSVVVFDHLKQEIILISNILVDEEVSERPITLIAKYGYAKEWLLNTQRKLLTSPIGRASKAESTKRRPNLVSLTSRRGFERIVRKAKKHIKEGDIFQVVLSRRWKTKSKLPSIEIYRKLRRINPSPYMFLLQFGDASVIGSSPEMLARVENDTIVTHPIAGTRPRGDNEAQDRRHEQSLLRDKKELAEHTMLLDLGRNDIGRVSKPGTVRVIRQMEVERYSHVMHMVSAVEGELSARMPALEGMFSCFPAGTVSGAPKIRAMEIIAELEELRRGVYAGAIAYLDFWGNLDSCIAIRTIVKQGESLYLQAGAGIVADSVPAREYDETAHKVEALFEALNS
jgi:anthranilate synthase component I